MICVARCCLLPFIHSEPFPSPGWWTDCVYACRLSEEKLKLQQVWRQISDVGHLQKQIPADGEKNIMLATNRIRAPLRGCTRTCLQDLLVRRFEFFLNFCNSKTILPTPFFLNRRAQTISAPKQVLPHRNICCWTFQSTLVVWTNSLLWP